MPFTSIFTSFTGPHPCQNAQHNALQRHTALKTQLKTLEIEAIDLIAVVYASDKDCRERLFACLLKQTSTCTYADNTSYLPLPSPAATTATVTRIVEEALECVRLLRNAVRGVWADWTRLGVYYRQLATEQMYRERGWWWGLEPRMERMWKKYPEQEALVDRWADVEAYQTHEELVNIAERVVAEIQGLLEVGPEVAAGTSGSKTAHERFERRNTCQEAF